MDFSTSASIFPQPDETLLFQQFVEGLLTSKGQEDPSSSWVQR